jgi:hypothetical protein
VDEHRAMGDQVGTRLGRARLTRQGLWAHGTRTQEHQREAGEQRVLVWKPGQVGVHM